MWPEGCSYYAAAFGSWVKGFGFKVQGFDLGFRVWGSKFRVGRQEGS